MTYNGWTNRETWLVNLWLEDYLTDLQSEGCPVNVDTIRDLVEELAEPAQENGLIADLLNGALAEINYREIAEMYQAEEEESE